MPLNYGFYEEKTFNFQCKIMQNKLLNICKVTAGTFFRNFLMDFAAVSKFTLTFCCCFFHFKFGLLYKDRQTDGQTSFFNKNKNTNYWCKETKGNVKNMKMCIIIYFFVNI